MAIQHSLGANIRRIRERNGWSQDVLSEMSGLDRTYISGIERGVRNPTLTIIQRLASALGVPIEDLVKGEGKAA